MSVGTTSATKLVALDVDGTVMTSEGIIPGAVIEAVAEARSNGIHVVVATGRSIVSTMPVVERLGIDSGWVVCSNGAVIAELDPAKDPIHTITDVVTFDPEPAMRTIREYLPDGLFAVENLGRGFFLTQRFPDRELDGEMTIVDFETLISIAATRVVIRSPGRASDFFAELIREIGLHGVNYAIGQNAWLDISPEGVTKASALDIVRRRLEVDINHTVAVGDGHNDIEMIQWANRGLAMGNANSELKAVANGVIGRVEEAAVAAILRASVAP